jgi:hypothetical protein
VGNDTKVHRAEAIAVIHRSPAQHLAALKFVIQTDIERATGRLETEKDSAELYRLQGEARALRSLIGAINGPA